MTGQKDPDFHPRAKHCWVTVDNQHVPGLLLGWRQQNGWEGWVVTVHANGGVAQQWVDADQIELATGPNDPRRA